MGQVVMKPEHAMRTEYEGAQDEEMEAIKAAETLPQAEAAADNPQNLDSSTINSWANNVYSRLFPHYRKEQRD